MARLTGRTLRKLWPAWGRGTHEGATLKPQASDARIYHRLVLAEGKGTWFIGFVDENTLIITPEEHHLKEALARAAGKGNANLRQDMQALLRRVEPRWSVWLAVLVHDQVMEDLIGGATIGEDIEINVQFAARAKWQPAAKGQVAQLCEEINEDLTSVRTSLASLGQTNPAFAPFTSLLTSVKATPGEKAAHLRLRIPAETIDQAVAKLDSSAHSR
jgi:hypothetical protein